MENSEKPNTSELLENLEYFDSVFTRAINAYISSKRGFRDLPKGCKWRRNFLDTLADMGYVKKNFREKVSKEESRLANPDGFRTELVKVFNKTSKLPAIVREGMLLLVQYSYRIYLKDKKDKEEQENG